ncbi:hypothetical protein AB1Y20_016256 [Prymnesium parvum]|uniref:ABM domain-containing protein n=1 Tax=Prymnesium parvum TaxID=97485 RepID=A0AB34IFF6_PRYPA|mmetsp:Transcript_37545/g.93336  ORF Transcript_37545/g.93336 Transcript_37545/m.93336 type:complete len:101 (-) Transcript_37545:309-611(-)
MAKHEAVYVTVTIPDEKMDEFLKVIQFDAEESRKEEGCTRFDVLQDRENPNVFHFYEVYVSTEAAAFHKTTPHYKMWADFKESAPTVGESQTVAKLYHLF